jgi:hypothetical protein
MLFLVKRDHRHPPVGIKITDLGFSYSVRGEVSNVYESTPHSSGYYSMSATYWPNGALDQIGGLPTLPTLTYTPDGEGRPQSLRPALVRILCRALYTTLRAFPPA